MTNNQLAMDLNISLNDINLKCNKPRGVFIIWLLRNVLVKEWYQLELRPEQKNRLIDMFKSLVFGKPDYARGVSDAWINGYLVLPDDYLQRLLVMYSRNNPFGVSL